MLTKITNDFVINLELIKWIGFNADNHNILCFIDNEKVYLSDKQFKSLINFLSAKKTDNCKENKEKELEQLFIKMQDAPITEEDSKRLTELITKAG